MDRSAIHLVHKRGKSLRAIAAELGHSKTTIARVLSEPVDQRPAHRTRVSVVDRWRKQIAGWRATNGSCWNTSRPWPTCRFASKVCRASICKGIGARSATSNSAISHQPSAISHRRGAPSWRDRARASPVRRHLARRGAAGRSSACAAGARPKSCREAGDCFGGQAQGAYCECHHSAIVLLDAAESTAFSRTTVPPWLRFQRGAHRGRVG
jgi:hypothetical protein